VRTSSASMRLRTYSILRIAHLRSKHRSGALPRKPRKQWVRRELGDEGCPNPGSASAHLNTLGRRRRRVLRSSAVMNAARRVEYKKRRVVPGRTP
jgi:hypothetical protein